MVQQSTLPELPLLEIEAAEFVYKPNFSGEAERYNVAGNRYFNVKIPDDQMANKLDVDGWNIKWTKPGANHPNPSEHVPEPYLEVTLGFKFRPPTVVLIRKDSAGVDRPTNISEKNCALLDSTEFDNIDMVIRARSYKMDSGQEGYKAYLKELYGRVTMSNIGSKYAYLTETVPEPASDDEPHF